MNHARMDDLQETVFEQIRKIRNTKGLEYATEEDTLADFKEVAVEAGITPLQVWATYVKKHERAIDTFIREGWVRSESIEGRILDVIVYHLLLYGLIDDLKRGERAAHPAVTVQAVVDPRPEEGPNPYDILRRWMGSQIDSTTLVAINAELKALGYEGTAKLNGNQLSYLEPPDADEVEINIVKTPSEGTDSAMAKARRALQGDDLA